MFVEYANRVNFWKSLKKHQESFVTLKHLVWIFGEAFFLAYSGSCMRPAAKKKAKKHTEHERVQFWGTTEHERREPYTHATRQKHTLNTRRCGFEYEWTREGLTRTPRWTQMYKSTYTHWKDVIHSTRTIPGPLSLENATEIRDRFAFLSCSVCFF